MVHGCPAELATPEYSSELLAHFESLYGEGSVAEVCFGTSNARLLQLFEERQYSSLASLEGSRCAASYTEPASAAAAGQART